MRADGIAYRINPAIMLAIDKAPDGKIQGLHSLGNYATMQTLQRHKAKASKVKPLQLTGLLTSVYNLVTQGHKPS